MPSFPLRRLFLFSAAIALLLAGTAQAVRVDPRGEGQVLIFPYYTTAAGNTTLLSLTNYRRQAKVVQLRIAEGENARTALTFNIYLRPEDTWTGALFDRGNGEPPALLTDDGSCTYPLIRDSTTLPQLPDGRRYAPLAVPSADAGSRGVARLREGFIEAVEVASIVTASPTYTLLSRFEMTMLPECWRLADYWATSAPAGRWTADPLADLANPTGGIGGEASIINIANGTVFNLRAVAIEDYRADPLDIPRGSLKTVAQHHRAGPDTGSLLTQALTDPAARKATAQVSVGTRVVDLSYAVPERAVDAVTAVLMATTYRATLEESPETGARSSYVLTYPTRSLYTDPAQSGSASPLAPFRDLFAGIQPLLDSRGIKFFWVDRIGYVTGRLSCEGFSGCPPPVLARLPGTAVELIAPGGAPDALLGTRLHGDVGRRSPGFDIVPIKGSGWLILDTAHAHSTLLGEPLRPSLEGRRLIGIPALGTRLANYVNANAAPGVLANYSFAQPMTSQVSCVEADGVDCAP